MKKLLFLVMFVITSVFALQAGPVEKPVAIFRGDSAVGAEYAVSYQSDGKKTLELSFGLRTGENFSPITDSNGVSFIAVTVTEKGSKSPLCYTVSLGHGVDKALQGVATFTGVKAGSKVEVYNGFGPVGSGNEKEPPLVSFIAGKQPAGSQPVDPAVLTAKTYKDVRSTLVSDPNRDLDLKLYQQGFRTYVYRLQMQH